MENLVGQTLTGRYRVLEVLGAGGMGVVYRARDERLERDVAIKLLAPGVLDDERVRKRFRKEALALSRLNHPNIAQVYDFVNEGGRDYIVMELVPGPTLDQKLTGGPLPQKEVLTLGKQLAEALAAAHQEGVIHRDLKPANLRFTGDHRIKVLDFGLAEVQTGPNAQMTTASFRSDSSVSGTLPYMAPEQLRGEAPDVRSDIYAAGAVLYEMATAKRAFPQTGYVIVDAILNQPPPPPAQLNPQISPGLENAILKALDKNPGFRYQTARDLLAELDRLTASTTISASHPQAIRTATGRQRAKLLAGWTIALVVLLAVAALVEHGMNKKKQEQEATSVGPSTTASTPVPSATAPQEAEPLNSAQPARSKRGQPQEPQAGIPPVPTPPAVGIDPNTIKEAMRAGQQEQSREAGAVNIEGAEGSAMGFVGAVSGIASAYHSKDPGYPESLQALFRWGHDHKIGGKLAENAAKECVMNPCINGNYTFRYTRTPDGFTLTARPIAYPYTGKRSFYSDQTGTMTATSENRAATAKDPAPK
jgi:serine/threonine protein kinase